MAGIIPYAGRPARGGGPAEALVRPYLGNLAASFAVFFIVASPPPMAGRPSWVAAVVALAVVQGFEVTNGFGVMTNTYDAWDLVANLAGVALAWAVDGCWRRVAQPAPSARVGGPEASCAYRQV